MDLLWGEMGAYDAAGIAVDKQHLIWKSVELEDKVKIKDYKMSSGTTLQLVTAMRGGPLNIRRGIINVLAWNHFNVSSTWWSVVIWRLSLWRFINLFYTGA